MQSIRSPILVFYPANTSNLVPVPASNQPCRHRHIHTHAIRKRPRPTTSHVNARHGQAQAYNLKFTASFTSTAPRSAKEQNHYETLGLPVTATAAEIKKKFYALSLKHHPDRNRTDPSASQRFARISAAYNVLGNASKRQSYDRDHGFHLKQHAHAHPSGSHSSHGARGSASGSGGGSYAGSRPASGLSKRRGTFTGPPPSFYANGGYGGTGRTSAEDGFRGAYGFGDGSDAHGFAGARAGAGAGAGARAAGFGAEWAEFSAEAQRSRDDPEDPFGFIRRNPLRHFNARAHYRTQRAEDLRRGERRSEVFHAVMKEQEMKGSGAEGSGLGARFRFNIAGVVGLLGITFSVVVLSEFSRSTSSDKK